VTTTVINKESNAQEDTSIQSSGASGIPSATGTKGFAEETIGAITTTPVARICSQAHRASSVSTACSAEKRNGGNCCQSLAASGSFAEAHWTTP